MLLHHRRGPRPWVPARGRLLTRQPPGQPPRGYVHHAQEPWPGEEAGRGTRKGAQFLQPGKIRAQSHQSAGQTVRRVQQTQQRKPDMYKRKQRRRETVRKPARADERAEFLACTYQTPAVAATASRLAAAAGSPGARCFRACEKRQNLGFHHRMTCNARSIPRSLARSAAID